MWDVTLQVCLSHILDNGGDAMHVLDHLAGAIASMHIPTSALVTRGAELLLSHLDAPALLRFVNDTTPEPQNKVASMWLICTMHHPQGPRHMPHQEAARSRWLGAHT